MTNAEEYMQSRLQGASAEEWDIFNCVKELCVAYDKSNIEIMKAISQAIAQYKNDGYGPIEKLLDMIAGLAKLTTAPIDTNKLDFEKVAHRRDMEPLLEKLANTVSDILARQNAMLEEKNARVEALASELTSVKQALSDSTNKKNALDRSLIGDVQRLISKSNLDEMADENHPINLILEDLGLSFIIDYESNPALFQKIKVSDISTVGVRLPAMLRGDKLVRQGTVHVVEISEVAIDASKEETTQE